jgi:hypothetical protein
VKKLPNEGSAAYMEVVYLFPGKALGMTRALGPLQSIAAPANSVLTEQFTRLKNYTEHGNPVVK